MAATAAGATSCAVPETAQLSSAAAHRRNSSASGPRPVGMLRVGDAPSRRTTKLVCSAKKDDRVKHLSEIGQLFPDHVPSSDNSDSDTVGVCPAVSS